MTIQSATASSTSSSTSFVTPTVQMQPLPNIVHHSEESCLRREYLLQRLRNNGLPSNEPRIHSIMCTNTCTSMPFTVLDYTGSAVNLRIVEKPDGAKQIEITLEHTEQGATFISPSIVTATFTPVSEWLIITNFGRSSPHNPLCWESYTSDYGDNRIFHNYWHPCTLNLFSPASGDNNAIVEAYCDIRFPATLQRLPASMNELPSLSRRYQAHGLNIAIVPISNLTSDERRRLFVANTPELLENITHIIAYAFDRANYYVLPVATISGTTDQQEIILTQSCPTVDRNVYRIVTDHAGARVLRNTTEVLHLPKTDVTTTHEIITQFLEGRARLVFQNRAERIEQLYRVLRRENTRLDDLYCYFNASDSICPMAGTLTLATPRCAGTTAFIDYTQSQACDTHLTYPISNTAELVSLKRPIEAEGPMTLCTSSSEAPLKEVPLSQGLSLYALGFSQNLPVIPGVVPMPLLHVITELKRNDLPISIISLINSYVTHNSTAVTLSSIEELDQ